MRNSPIGPQPKDADARPRTDLCQPDGVEGNPERFEHRDVGIPQAVGHGDKAPGGPRHELAQRAVRRAVTRKAMGEAKVGVPGSALFANLARNGWIDRHALATARPRLDHAGRLVAQNDRAGETSAPIPDSAYQWRSEPQIPTAVTRTSSSPGPGTGAASSTRRRSPVRTTAATSCPLLGPGGHPQQLLLGRLRPATVIKRGSDGREPLAQLGEAHEPKVRQRWIDHDLARGGPGFDRCESIGDSLEAGDRVEGDVRV